MFDTDIVLKKLDEAERRAQQVGPVEDAHSLLRAVYSNPAVPLNTRLKAASLAIEYERPKLAVSAVVSGQDLGALLDARTKRIQEGKIGMNGGAKVKTIEAKVNRNSEPPKQVQTKVQAIEEELDL